MNGEKGRLRREAYKVKREIETHGNSYVFYRETLNKEGEPTKDVKQVITVRGLFHVSGGYVSRETISATERREKRKPMLLCLWEETKEIKNKDFVMVNGQKFIVVNKRNVNEYNIVSDLSLEVVLNGNN